MAFRHADVIDNDPEMLEWLESMESLLRTEGPERAKAIFRSVQEYLADNEVIIESATLNTPYRNSIPVDQQPAYPGDIELESCIEDILRWNAMAMVLRALDAGTGVGGHAGEYRFPVVDIDVMLGEIEKGYRTGDTG